MDPLTKAFILISSFNKFNKRHVVVRSQGSTAGISAGVQGAYTGKGSSFREKKVVASSKIFAITNQLWKRFGHPFLYLLIRLLRTSVVRHTFACFCADETPAAIPR